MRNEPRIDDRRSWLRRAATGVVGVGALGLTRSDAQAAHPFSRPLPGLAPDPRFLTDSFRARLNGMVGTPTPSATLGPYYLSNMPVRSDITEGQTGLPLRLYYQVRDVNTSQPLANRVVDVWHANACGVYSGFSQQGTQGQTYLRGQQLTNSAGWCFFDTIFPGWYTGRTSHIHAKVKTSVTTTQGLTTQFFFDELNDYPNVDVNPTVYQYIAPYGSCGAPQRTTNAQDGIYNPVLSQTVIIRPDGIFGLWAGIVIFV